MFFDVRTGVSKNDGDAATNRPAMNETADLCLERIARIILSNKPNGITNHLPVGLRQINPTGNLALHRTPKSVI